MFFQLLKRVLLVLNYLYFHISNTVPLKETSQLERSASDTEALHTLLLGLNVECLKATSIEPSTQIGFQWTDLSYSPTGDRPVLVHHTYTNTRCDKSHTCLAATN